MFGDKNHHQPQIRVVDYAKPKTLTSGMRNSPESPQVSRRWIWIISVVAGVIILVALGLFIRSQQQLSSIKKDLESAKNDPTVQTKDANKQLLEQVGKLIILPTNEEPTIATVSDLRKLEGQPFFAKAQVGDKVLIYQLSKKAILFRPSENKIIELAPLNTGAQVPAQ